jgi:predicted nucleotidyltransferase
MNKYTGMYLERYQNRLSTLCRQYNVKTLHAFGSILTERFGNDSDVDLIVAFNDIPVEDYADNYFNFKFSLQDVFNRPVDLLEEQAIKNPYFRQNIDRNKQMIYG